MGCDESKSAVAPQHVNQTQPVTFTEEGVYIETEEVYDNDEEYNGPTEPEHYEFSSGEIPLDRFALTGEDVYATPHNLQSIQKMYQESMKGQQLLDPELRPPPLSNKSDILAKLNMPWLDEKADSTPLEVALGGFSQLVQHLCKGLSSEIEAARVFFRWMGAMSANPAVDEFCDQYDLDSENPLFYIQGIREGKGINYVILLHKLFFEAGIVAQVVRGITKSAQYKIGHYVNTTHGSVWLAALLENQWRFIDPIWACQVLQGYDSGEWSKVDENLAAGSREEQSGSLGFKINEFYFLTDPQYAILEHFPYDARWQLLPRPLSLKEFEEIPHCEPEEMARLGLEIVSHPKCVFEIKDSETSAQEKKLRVHIKKGQDNTLFFTEDTTEFNVFSAQLYIHSSSLNSEETGNVIQYKAKRWQLQHFCITGHSVKLKELFITVIPPVAGKFLLKLFGARCSDDSLKHVISYVFHCQQPADVVPIPPANLTEWGPGGQTAEAGLTPLTHPDPIIELLTGETTIKFETRNSHLQYLVQLSSTDQSVRSINQYVILWKEGTNIVIKVRAPKEGLYAIYLSCILPKGGTVPICDYLVDAQVPCIDSYLPYPKLKENQYLGVHEQNCKTVSTWPSSHKTGYFECNNNSVKIIWEMPKQVIYCSTLFLQDERGHQDYSQYVLIETSQLHKKAFMHLKFPQVGYYLFSLGGLAEDESTVLHLCNYIIKVNNEPYINALPFPKLPIHWQKGFRLIHPESHLMEANKYVQIIIKIEGFFQVENFQLRSEKPLMMFFMQSDSDGVWKSTIDSGAPGTKWALNVNNKNKSSEKLFEFVTMTDKETIELKKKHDDYSNLYNQVKQKRIDYDKWLQELDERLKQQATIIESLQDKSKEENISEPSSSSGVVDLDIETEALDEMIKDAERQAKKATDATEKEDKEELTRQLKQKSLKIKMKLAIQNDDITLMQKYLSEFEKVGLEDVDLRNLAQQKLALFTITKDLKEAEIVAVKQKNSATLKSVIGNIEKSEYRQHAQVEKVLSESYKVLARVERLEKLYGRILNMDKKSVAELRTYSNPSAIIVDIMRATLLLLGEYEKKTNVWARCKTYLNPTGNFNLQNEIKKFLSDDLHPSIAARAKVILQPYKEEEAVQVSAAAAAFYGWSIGVIVDKEETCDPRLFIPANLDRQRKILNVSKEEHNQLMWADQKK